MIALCPACRKLFQDTIEAAMGNEPCPACWTTGYRPNGLGGARLAEPDPDPARLAEFDAAVGYNPTT